MNKKFLTSKWEWFSFTNEFRKEMISEILSRHPSSTFTVVRETIESIVLSKREPAKKDKFTYPIWKSYQMILEEIDLVLEI